jgi:tripartite-type tricarboxylate transporter receptor subunit TctC
MRERRGVSRRGMLALGLMGWSAAVLPAAAESYPSRPIRLVIPFPAGGASDVLGRIVADRMAAVLGQGLIVDNRSGAGGNLGADLVAKAPPDGYTILLCSSGTHAINVSLYEAFPYDAEKDFAPISLFAIVPNILVVHPSLPVHSATEFIAYAKAHPGQLNYGSIGNGSSQHLAGAYFEMATGVRLQHVPYRGIPQMMADLLAGDLQLSFQLIPNVVEQVKAGQLRPIAVTSSARSSALPAVPTMAEAGVANYETAGWFGLMAPAQTPSAIVETLHHALVQGLARADTRARFAELGAEPVGSSPDEFARFIHAEIPKWRVIVKASGAHID